MESGRRLSYVQVSRGIAILFVLLGHVNILFYSNYKYEWFHIGQWERTGGVDFFFIVTGFMSFYLYHKHAGVPGKAFEFLIKRVIRIYPLYWMFTLLAIAVSIIFPSLDGAYSIETIIRSMIIFPTEPILASTWSLSHVLFFYLLFTAYIFKPKISKRIIFVWVIATILIELKAIPISGHTFFVSFSSLEIILGSTISYLTMNFTFRYSSLYVFMGVLGYLAVWINNIYILVDIQTPIFYCLFSMILMLGIAEKDKKNRKVPKVLSFLGDASYSIYIAHGPFLQLYILILLKLKLIDTIGYFFSMVIVILLAVISSCFVYKIIEKPMLNYLRKIVFRKKNQPIEIQTVIAK